MNLNCKLPTLLGILGSLVVLTFLFYQAADRKENDILTLHCDNINKDITRPDDRMCAYPISIQGNYFTFETITRKKEIYEVVETISSDGKDKDYFYIFYNEG